MSYISRVCVYSTVRNIQTDFNLEKQQEHQGLKKSNDQLWLVGESGKTNFSCLKEKKNQPKVCYI